MHGHSFIIPSTSPFVRIPLHKKSCLFSTVAPVEAPPLSPLTQWGQSISDISSAQASSRARTYDFPKTVHKKDVVGSEQSELDYFKANAESIKDGMEMNGAVVFRGFDMMKSQEGFVEFYSAIGMNPCLDPLHSVSARPTINGDKKSAVYEAVNKESRKNFFIGMHNEFVGTRAPRAAAFVCFKAAEIGGEFLIADGR